MDMDDNTLSPDVERRPRGRPRRIEEEQQRRRRREDSGPTRAMHLTVRTPKDPDYEYRWVNADPGRVHQLTVEDDWDVVEASGSDDRNVGVGTADERVVDKSTGKKAILLRKRREFYHADKAKEAAVVNEREALIKQGLTAEGGGLTPSDNMYIPAGGIRLNAGR